MTHLPLAQGEDRLQVLFRLPMQGEERRVLELRSPNLPVLPWDGLQIDSYLLTEYADLPEMHGRYDAVFLRGVLGEATPAGLAFRTAGVVAMASRALRPGGLLVAYLDHLMAPKQLWSWLKVTGKLNVLRALGGYETASRCKSSLAAAGFECAECFFVEPNIEDPAVLISSNRLAAVSHFEPALHRNRDNYTGPGFWVRWLVVQLGLGGLLQPQLFVWARKRC